MHTDLVERGARASPTNHGNAAQPSDGSHQAQMGFMQCAVICNHHDDGVETIKRVHLAWGIAGIQCRLHRRQGERHDARRGFLHREALQRCPHCICTSDS